MLVAKSKSVIFIEMTKSIVLYGGGKRLPSDAC